MAEAFANKYSEGKIVAQSAGIKLAPNVNPLVVEALREKGHRHFLKQASCLPSRCQIKLIS